MATIASGQDQDKASEVLFSDIVGSCLTTRLNALCKFQGLISDMSEGTIETKPGLIKRICRSLTVLLFESHHFESVWVSNLLFVLVEVGKMSNALFDVKEYSTEYLVEVFSKSTYSSSKRSVIAIGAAYLLNWFDETLVSAASIPTWVSHLLTVIGQAFEEAALQVGKINKNTHAEQYSEIAVLWRSRVALLPLFSTVWSSNGFATSIVAPAALARFLITEGPINAKVAATGSALVKPLKTVVIERYIKRVLNGAVGSMPHSFLIHLAPFFGLLESADWDDGRDGAVECLLTHVVRAMKKAPEGSSSVISELLTQVNVNLSSFVTAGAAVTALRLCKATAEDVRTNGMSIFRSLALKARDSTAFSVMVRVLLDSLQGKGGQLHLPVQRGIVIVALKECADVVAVSIGRGFAAEISTECVSILLAHFEREVDENIRYLCSNCVASWQQAGGSTSSAFIAALAASLSKGKPSSELHLLAFVLSRSEADELSVLEPHLPLLINVVKEAQKKPQVAHFDAVLALRCLFQLSRVSSSASAALTTNKLWGVIFSGSSFLYARTLVNATVRSAYDINATESATEAKLQQLGVVAAAETIATSISDILHIAALSNSVQLFGALENDVIDSSGNFIGSVGQLLHALLQHPSCNVRNYVSKNIQNILSSETSATSVCAKLVDKLSKSVEAWSRQREDARKEATRNFKGSATSEDAAVPVNPVFRLNIPSSNVLSFALISCLPPRFLVDQSQSQDLQVGDVVANVLLLVCHPLVTTSASRGARLLTQVLQKFGLPKDSHGSAILPAGAIQILGAKIIDLIQGDAASLKCAVNAVELICAHFGESGYQVVHSLVLPYVLQTLSLETLTTISASDIQTFQNPETAIARLVAAAEVSASDIKITNADRKKDSSRGSRRGQFEADLLQDEDWAERVRQEKAQKLNQAKAGGFGDLAEKARKDVELICSRVDAVVSGAVRVMQMLVDLTTRRVTTVNAMLRRLLPSLMSRILSLLSSSLLEASAFNCINSLVKLIDPKFSSLSRDLAASIRIVCCKARFDAFIKDSKSNRSEDEGPVLRLLRGLSSSRHLLVASGASVDSQGSESSSTVYLVLPVLKGLLSVPGMCPGTEASFSLFDRLWSYSSHIEEVRRGLLITVMEMILTTLASNPRLEPSPEVMFARVVLSSNPLEINEWGVLMSDQGVLCADPKVRRVCYQVISSLLKSGVRVPHDALIESRLWMAKFDSEDADNQTLGNMVFADWETNSGSSISNAFAASLLPLFSHSAANVRSCAGRSLAGALTVYPELAESTVAKVLDMYNASCPVIPERIRQPPAGAVGILGGGKKDKVGSTTSGSAGLGIGAGKLTALAAPIREVEDSKFPTRLAVATFLEALGTSQALASVESHLIESTLRMVELSDDVAVPTARRNTSEIVSHLLDFTLTFGVVDHNEEVRRQMIFSGRHLVDGYAENRAHCTNMLSAIEAVLARKLVSNDSAEIEAFDHRHEAAVVLLGAVGKHLDKDDPAILTITDTLVSALKIPSEAVQIAVSDCLAPLIQVIKTSEHAKQILETLMGQLVTGSGYGDRRGAAMGLSACVKGIGIPSLKQHDVVGRLKEMCANESANGRQGALFAMECLSDRLGLLFEPYVISIVPVLLKSFSHSSDHVREAAQGAARVIMGRLSAHGVKQILTPILTSLATETAWKSRQEAIRLLGTMAHCAPKQLSACLPQIVPKLVESGSDPHPKVKESVKIAMQDISSVIRNPEISRLSPVLLAALSDPANKTKDALEELLVCEFMHAIDSPSLALLIPLLGRALRERTADLKRKGSAITGNIMSMIGDPKSIIPYLPSVIPGIKGCLVDPIPDVRATSAKALGALMAAVSEELTDMIPWLLQTMQSDASPVERSGAAQGLSEICVATFATGQLQVILDQTMGLQSNSRASSREGLLWLLSFLPATLHEKFGPFIPSTLPVILAGLSDENEGVREVAMRAGQVVVSILGKSHTHDVLPPLTQGMFNEDYRIRHSSVVLLGDLLYMVGDTKAVGMADGEDENEDLGTGVSGSSRAAINIRAHCGERVANAMFASLYIIRSDVASNVRQAALQVWKSVISNTPRTLVEIMGDLVSQVVDKLASQDAEELRYVAGKALGDIVKKLGDRVLPVIMPHLRKGQDSDDIDMRQGVCLGLAEILAAASRKQVEEYLDILVQALQQSLCDASPQVRQQAARAFLTLFKAIGEPAVQEVVPSLLLAVEEGGTEGEMALLGLKEIVVARPRDLLEYLLPKLLTHPLESLSARAFGFVVGACSQQLHYHYSFLVPYFCEELVDCTEALADGGDEEDVERLTQLKACAAATMAATSAQGVSYLFSEVGAYIEDDSDSKKRQWGCWLIEQFLRTTKTSFEDFVPILLKYLLGRVAETDKNAQQAVSDALQALTIAIPVDQLVNHLEFIRNCISSTASDSKYKVGASIQVSATGEFILPLFSIPKCLEPLLAIFLHGLMNGTIQQREMAADGIGELLNFTEPTALKPYLIKTTGPLIRVVGDKFPSSVKASILQTLCILLDKGGAALKAFAPQLNTTFIKSLQDPSKQVRQWSVLGLGKVMPLSARVDPLVSELAGLILNAQGDSALSSVTIRTSCIDALAVVLLHGGDKATAVGIEKAQNVVLNCGADEDENIRAMAAKCAGSLAAYLDAAQTSDILITFLDSCRAGGAASSSSSSTNTSRVSLAVAVGALLTTAAICHTAGQKAVEIREEVFALIRGGLGDERIPVRVAAFSAIGTLLTFPMIAGAEAKRAEFRSSAQACLASFAPTIGEAALKDESSDVRKAAVAAIKQGAKHFQGATSRHVQHFMPALVQATNDFNLSFKYMADRTMKYLLDGGSTQGVANFASACSDADTVKFVRDYSKRILSQLPADSGDELDKW